MTDITPTDLEGKSGEAALKAAKLPEAETKNSVSPAEKPSKRGAYVVGKGQTDTVLFSRAVYKAERRKSATVHHLQRRLAELGYAEAGADKDGWLGDLTLLAINNWQKDNKRPVGVLTADDFEAIFEGDVNVTVDLHG